MIVKIQNTIKRHFHNDTHKSKYFTGWAIFGNVKEVHQLEPVDNKELNKPDSLFKGRVYCMENWDGDPKIMNRILVKYDDGSTDNFYFDGSAYLMNDDGETIENLY